MSSFEMDVRSDLSPNTAAEFPALERPTRPDDAALSCCAAPPETTDAAGEPMSSSDLRREVAWNTTGSTCVPAELERAYAEQTDFEQPCSQPVHALELVSPSVEAVPQTLPPLAEEQADEPPADQPSQHGPASVGPRPRQKPSATKPTRARTPDEGLIVDWAEPTLEGEAELDANDLAAADDPAWGSCAGESELGEESEPENGFASLGLSPRLLSAVEAAGYRSPTPIQAQTIPCLLEGRDVLGQAQTGTGKTAAFALPLLDRLDLRVPRPQILVLTPTRELAIQVAASFEKYAGARSGFRVMSIFGGQDYNVQFRQLDRGVHVVVGTPGRVMDHMRRGTLNLDELRCLVLDEADEMLRMGFAEDVEWVLNQAPADRQMALFSATLPGPIRQIAQRHLKDPVEITIGQRTATAETIEQRYVVVAPHQKEAALSRILEAEPTDGALVFVRTRATTEPLAEYLTAAGFKAAALNGDLAQKQRTKLVQGLKSGEIDVLVATDVAARGLDVQRVSHVINYDLPVDTEAYIHRIGRTGRAGRTGVAILFVHPRDRSRLRRLEQVTRQTITPMEFPTNRKINKQRVARFHERINQAMSHADLATFQAVVEHYQRENEVPLDLIAAALATLAHGSGTFLLKEDFKAASFEEDSRRKSREARGGREPRGGQGSRREAWRDEMPREPRGDRDLRGGKPPRQAAGGPSFRTRADDAQMETYRLEVGRAHQVQPGNIVGAIANEAQIGSELIGKISIFDQFSTVDLPASLAPKILAALRETVIAGRKLRLTRLIDRRPPAARFAAKPGFPPRSARPPRPTSKPGRSGPKAKHRSH